MQTGRQISWRGFVGQRNIRELGCQLEEYKKVAGVEKEAIGVQAGRYTRVLRVKCGFGDTSNGIV